MTPWDRLATHASIVMVVAGYGLNYVQQSLSLRLPPDEESSCVGTPANVVDWDRPWHSSSCPLNRHRVGK